MARKIIQDVVVGKRKKLETPVPITISKTEDIPNDVPVKVSKENPFLRRKESSPVISLTDNKKYSIPFPKLPRRKGEGFWEKPALWWSLGGVVLVVGGLFIFSAYFLKISVEITPAKASLPVSVSLNAKKSSSSDIPFEIIMTKGTETKQVTATGSKNIDIKASGRIVVYNNYSDSTQKLISGTRFVASNGKTYRIPGDIVVPGKKGDIPGSIEVTVYADQAGADYNTELTDFTIPGFKGDPRYDKFYGRSKTEISGGFSGMSPVASDEDVALAKISIEKSLKEDLLRDASSQVPDGYILYRDAVQLSFESIKNVGSDPKVVTVGENGTLVGVLLKMDSISSEIAKKITTEKNDIKEFAVDSIDGLVFAFAPNTPIIDAKSKEVSFSLNGNADIVHTIDIPTLKNDLAGKAKADFSSILSKYPSINQARIVPFQPFSFLAGHFPSKIDKISITIAK